MFEHIDTILGLSERLGAVLNLIANVDARTVNIRSITASAELCIELQNQINEEVGLLFSEWKENNL